MLLMEYQIAPTRSGGDQSRLRSLIITNIQHRTLQSSSPVSCPIYTSVVILTGMMKCCKFFPDVEVSVGDGDITGDDDIRREDVPVDPGAEGDVQESRGVGPHQGVHPLHVVSAVTEM